MTDINIDDIKAMQRVLNEQDVPPAIVANEAEARELEKWADNNVSLSRGDKYHMVISGAVNYVYKV